MLLYDRAFVAESWGDVWRRRRWLHLALAGTWLLLGWLVLEAENRGGSVGIGRGITRGAFALTQFRTLVHYLRLSVWPCPLSFDYEAHWVKHAADVVPFALLLAPPVAGTIFGLRRWPVCGFLGA